jgi:hypothetical protein
MGWAFAAATTLAVILVVSRLIWGVPQVMRGMLRFDGLTWPRGVQEDDDFAWRWSSPPRAHHPADGLGRHDLADGAPASAPTQRLRPRIRAGSTEVRWSSRAPYPSRSAREMS